VLSANSQKELLNLITQALAEKAAEIVISQPASMTKNEGQYSDWAIQWREGLNTNNVRTVAVSSEAHVALNLLAKPLSGLTTEILISPPRPIQGRTPSIDWTVQWRDRANRHNIRSFEAGSRAEIVLNLLAQSLSSEPTEVSVSQPPPPIAGTVPYADIVKALKGGDVIPFLGAGVPLSNRNPNRPWAANEDFLPNGVELARYLAKRSGMPVWQLRDTDNLARVASYFRVTNRDVTLARELQSIFTKGNPTDTHQLIASMLRKLKHPLLIVSTNYDLLMEKALEGLEYDRVIHCGELRGEYSVLLWKSTWSEPKAVTDDELKKEIDLSQRTVLYKMHGSVDTVSYPGLGVNPEDDQFVITEEHYVDFLSRINAFPPAVPNAIKAYFGSYSFLFLGYSLDDWNLRVILHSLKGILTRSADKPVANLLGFKSPRTHWAIQRDPTEYDQKVWQSRNVVIGNRDLNQFVMELLDPAQKLFAS
jgi:hypothetical protein